MSNAAARNLACGATPNKAGPQRNLPGRCAVPDSMCPRLCELLGAIDPEELECDRCGQSVFEPHCSKPMLGEKCRGDARCAMCSHRHDGARGATVMVGLPTLFTPRPKDLLKSASRDCFRHYGVGWHPVCDYCAGRVCTISTSPLLEDWDQGDDPDFDKLRTAAKIVAV